MPTVWQIAGAGDYNGDGRPDILWQNMSTGERGVYLMNGTSVTGWLSLGIVSTDWSLGPNGTLKQTVANNPDDFNGDGQSDILWQNTSTGERGIYLMNGTTVTSWMSLGTVPTTWQIMARATLTAMASRTSLAEHDDREYGLYLMNGTTVTAGSRSESFRPHGRSPAPLTSTATARRTSSGKTLPPVNMDST